jgi:hypothetical protein
MLVDGLKIGGRDHARAVIPVSAISAVAEAPQSPISNMLTFEIDVI